MLKLSLVIPWFETAFVIDVYGYGRKKWRIK
jgi:hypothetical protein